jgi:molybdate transport system regulatory protein
MLSARNKIRGIVNEVKCDGVMGIVKVEAGDEKITASISAESVRDLKLAAGSKVVAVIKATEVMMANDKLVMSARNQFRGTVRSLEKDALMAIVKLDVPGDIGLTALISAEAADQLGLAVGKEAVAVVKATSVMIAAD